MKITAKSVLEKGYRLPSKKLTMNIGEILFYSVTGNKKPIFCIIGEDAKDFLSTTNVQNLQEFKREVYSQVGNYNLNNDIFDHLADEMDEPHQLIKELRLQLTDYVLMVLATYTEIIVSNSNVEIISESGKNLFINLSATDYGQVLVNSTGDRSTNLSLEEYEREMARKERLAWALRS